MSLDVVCIKPGSQRQIYGVLSDHDLTAVEPPLWAALIAAILRREGFSVAILDAEIEGLSWDETAKRVADMDPKLALMVVSGTNPSASTMNMTGAGAILSRLAEIAPKIHRSISGLHPSALPGRTIEEEAVDSLVDGEGFTTIPELARALVAGEAPDGISGLWRKRNGVIQVSSKPPLLTDLDALPAPAWDLLPMLRYRAHNWHCFDDVSKRSPYAVIYTSLGCPFHCHFCCINAMFGPHKLRRRSVDAVVEEIKLLATGWGIRNIKILDELFAYDERRTVELCEKIAALDLDLNFWAYARVNTVTQAMLAAMKAAGIHWIAYGFESGNKRVINDVTKGYNLDHVERVVDWTYKAGQHICANFIFGLPEDDYDSMQDTLDLMIRINAEWCNIYSAMAYPGSKLYDDAVAQGLPLPKTWADYSQYSRGCTPLPTKHLSGGQVLSFRDYAFDAYHRNPRYLWRIKKIFGEETMRAIQTMSEKRLVRDHAHI